MAVKGLHRDSQHNYGDNESLSSRLEDVVEELLCSQCVYIVYVKTTMTNCFLMLSLLKTHVILFMDIFVVMLLCSMLEINDDVLHCIALHCIALHCIALHCIALHCIVLY